MGKVKVQKRNPEVSRQIRRLHQKKKESRMMPINDRFAHGKNLMQSYLSNFKGKKAKQK